MFELLAYEVKALRQLDRADLTDDELESTVLEPERVASSFEALRAELAAAFSARGSWVTSGA
ncbi:MAG TPA: hypothetical protein VM143_08785 [Acidimicrobiales bacterium]|nr:hypothetical protein [Acidimicrobiales bacterium]